MINFLTRYSSLILAVSVVFIQGCGESEQTASKGIMPVVVAPALQKELTITKEIIGQTRAYDNVELVARVQGFLTNRLFKEGQMVKKGDLLFEIEKDQYDADLQTAQAALLKAQALRDNAEIEYNRNKGLVEKNAVSKREYDFANAQYLQAKAAVMSAEAAVKKAQINLNYTSILAPFDGQIGVAYVSVGNLVGTNDTKLATILSVDPMRVQFNIGELDILKFEQKENPSFEETSKYVNVSIYFQNGTKYGQPGKLYFSDNRINPSTGTIMVEALFPNKAKELIPGFYVKVLLESNFTTPGIVIPQSAIMEGQAGSSVYVVGSDSTVSMKMVKTGVSKAPYIQINDGLKEGDLVVTEGLQNLAAGVKVSYTYDLAYAADSTRADPLKPSADSQRAQNKR
ncbi:MAG TPA: efflux transporter periplasmic adaptor subunit [Lentisphaeria bacterium]|nr:MAG: hypothetical protein A2X47_04535 [Lentisphaerae bacterium GWF2_38_69]HBM16258.1 efflux transporter periplasmic adaptor subunit [Lentisphaeria bacterium]